ncbi:acyl-CoA thioesterase [Acetohalobium arabaticum]|uniref:Thioesterase superfamily protein n=1 Tax=Acetohalobium arabaticum (strain ATCC 49924 / DSM 5501 / Z-7288) TaxID=574087 RepID=D9QUC5_ACEAZ|nr:thioesterase family protein [Acetohalobium arabaticum]ADL11918.1 thioesterase superfamily protein [Acetohalobium arabaticum DSM 5501]
MSEHSHQIRVTYQETDKMGVVYYANYLRWFEIGRTEYMRQAGVTYKELEDEGVFLPVLESHCKYHNPARYDDLIRIETTINKLKRVRIGFSYEILHSESDELLAAGNTSHSFVNQDFEPISLQREKPEVWQLIQRSFDKKK